MKKSRICGGDRTIPDNNKDFLFDGQKDARRGTKLWALNYFRTKLLSSLIKDLREFEKGFSEEVCKVVRKVLFTILEELRRIPQGGFQKAVLLKELEEFDKIYHDWNNIEGEDEYAAKKRKELLSMQHKKREKVSSAIRHGQGEFHNLIDETLIDKVFMQVGQLLKSYNSMFLNVDKAYLDFVARRNVSAVAF